MANKYRNKKIINDGIKYDSKLEFFMAQMLKAHDIEFDFQVEVELIPKHKINGNLIRRSVVRVDFVIKNENEVLYIDTKGFATDTSKLKYKLLGYLKLQEGAKFKIIWLQTKGEVIDFINKIKKNE